MKRLIGIAAIVLLVGAIAVPLMAYGPGGGRGGYMMSGRDGNTNYGPYNRSNDTNLTTEQREQLDALNKKFSDETTQLRDDLWAKRTEFDNVLNAADPDIEKAKAIQNEISDLQAKLAEKRVELEVEERKIAPDTRYSYGHGGHMMDFGRGMMDGGNNSMGRGGYMGGYGSETCWL